MFLLRLIKKINCYSFEVKLNFFHEFSFQCEIFREVNQVILDMFELMLSSFDIFIFKLCGIIIRIYQSYLVADNVYIYN